MRNKIRFSKLWVFFHAHHYIIFCHISASRLAGKAFSGMTNGQCMHEASKLRSGLSLGFDGGHHGCVPPLSLFFTQPQGSRILRATGNTTTQNTETTTGKYTNVLAKIHQIRFCIQEDPLIRGTPNSRIF